VWSGTYKEGAVAIKILNTTHSHSYVGQADFIKECAALRLLFARYRALFVICRSLFAIYRALFRIYRALFRICRIHSSLKEVCCSQVPFLNM